MVKLIVIADDFTGALDTGIPFSRNGISTIVATQLEDGFLERTDAEVVVIDAGSRHSPPEQAYKQVFEIARQAVRADVPVIYKKTDSGLRGCIGSELSAVLHASEEREVQFVPAFPRTGRVTRDGYHYLDGIPIHQSVFGQDPFEPVRHSYIPDIIKQQTDTPAAVVHIGENPPALPPDTKRIVVYDAETEQDLQDTARRLKQEGKLKVLAGCAGLACVLPDLIDFRPAGPPLPAKSNGLFVLCGSLNPITEEQIRFAQANGFHRISLSPAQKLQEAYFDTPEGKAFQLYLEQLCRSGIPVVVDTLNPDTIRTTNQYALQHRISLDSIRERVAMRLSELAGIWLDFGLGHSLMVTGGDVLRSVMDHVQCRVLHPICELYDGVVVSRLFIRQREIQVISKSGGFGNTDALLSVYRTLSCIK